MGKRGRPKKILVAGMTSRATPVSVDVRSSESKKEISPAMEILSMNKDTSYVTVVSKGKDIPESSQMASAREIKRRLDMDQSPEQKRATKGMPLNFIAPTLKNGTPTACLDNSALEIEASKWKHAIILYVIGDSPTISFVRTFLIRQCKETEPEIFLSWRRVFYG